MPGAFATLQAAPPDSILGLAEAFRADTRPEKISLASGVYVDERGITPVLDTVTEAEQRILDAQTLDTMVAAALGEVDGRIIDIDADDDNRSPFDISILTADRQIVEITLDGSGAVIGTEIDD